MLHGLRDGEVGHARFHNRNPVGKIDLEDSIEFRHAEEDAVAQRQRPARQRRAGPPRHHLDAVLVAVAQYGGDLIGRVRQHHNQGKLPISGQAVRLIWAHFALRIDHALGRYHSPERPYDLAAALEHPLVRNGHCYRHL